jgi:site-specific DNA-methyltransferase (adenine-specific)
LILEHNLNNILHGPALDKLKELDSESVDCCITSPPYWALRDYKQVGQLGLEPTFQEYITKLIEIFNQVKRVLKKTGSCWVNIGDTYNTDAYGGNRNGTGKNTKVKPRWEVGGQKFVKPEQRTVPDKCLCLIPQRFQIAMVDQGWICRNTIIWYKPNCMPSSAKDRFTVDFEYLFFFTKSQKYYFDTQYEPHESSEEKYNSSKKKWFTQEQGKYNNETKTWHEFGDSKPFINPQNPLGRIKRCVWKIPTQPFSEAHFAVFPPALVETPLKACCPEYICKKCGKPREKITEPIYHVSRVYPKDFDTKGLKYGQNFNRDDNKRDEVYAGRPRVASHVGDKVLGFKECDCNAGFDGGIVLDPFIGSGTVGLVAMQNARNFIGIELSQAYIDMAMKRLEPYLLQTRLT